jgi:hypothetical protein
MKAAELQAVEARLDVLREILVELIATLPPERASGFAAALGNRLAGRFGRMEIDERIDDALVSDVAPVFAAVGQRSIASR